MSRAEGHNDNDLDSLLIKHRVLICVGSGGVGKTTLSASLGVRAAQLGRRTLVLTIDPSQRLASALGLDISHATNSSGRDPEHRLELRLVPGQDFPPPGILSAALMDSQEIFDQFIARHAPSHEAGKKILQNSLYRQLSTSLSGSQEFTALERLLSVTESGDWDLVILDTPPAQHAIDFLRSPQRLNALFEDHVIRWFINSINSHDISSTDRQQSLLGTLWKGVVARGSKTVLHILESLTGKDFIRELGDFFTAIREIQSSLAHRITSVQKLLEASTTTFIMVSSFDEPKLREAEQLRASLQKMNLTLKCVLVNRAFPTWIPQEDKHESVEQVPEKLKNYYIEFQKLYKKRYELLANLAIKLEKEKILLFEIPEFEEDIHGLNDLLTVAAHIGQATKYKEKISGQ